MEVEKFINETTYKHITLKFWVKFWCLSYMCGCFVPNVNDTKKEYAEKFKELSRFFPYINAVGAEVSKCLKFENGLRPEIKQFIGHQQIHQFSLLVTTCWIYEDQSKGRASHYKAVSEKKGRDLSRGKPYNIPIDKENQKKGTSEKEVSGEDVRPPRRCYNCGDTGHRVS